MKSSIIGTLNDCIIDREKLAEAFPDGDELNTLYNNDKENIKEAIWIVNKYYTLFSITFGQYSSLEDFEKAKREFLEELDE